MLHWQGQSIAAIARQLRLTGVTVRTKLKRMAERERRR
jgi:DNA-binding CsgD family transcriptional regulator